MHEEITLLALRDQRGTFRIGVSYDYAIGGAVLAELLLHRRLSVDHTAKNGLAQVTSAEPIGDPLLDECLQRVISAKKRASLQTWVSRFASVRGLRPRIAEQLCLKGILRADAEKVFWLFNRKVYPEIDHHPEQLLIDRIKRAILSDERVADARTVVIISLAKSAGLLSHLFDRESLRRRKVRIRQIINGEVVGKATEEAIQAMQAAVVATCIVPAITVTTTCH